MGFKRTSEGRVFFKGNDYSANDEVEMRVKQERPAPSPGMVNSRDQTQLQILTLLKSLNEKLKSTQADRRRMQAELEAYRSLVEDLEIKTKRGEKAYLELEKKLERAEKAEDVAKATFEELEKTRKTLLALENKSRTADHGVSTLKSQIAQNLRISKELSERQVELEKKQRDHTSRIDKGLKTYHALTEKIQQTAKVQNDLNERVQKGEQKQKDLDERVNEANTQNQLLLKRVDQVAEDRARFMRKIELIEETVLQTRDALQAPGSRPLLAGKAELSADDLPRQFQEPHTDMYDSFERPKLPRTSFGMKAIAVSFLIVAGILGGWLISELQKPQLRPLDVFDLTILDQKTVPTEKVTENVRGYGDDFDLPESKSLKVFSDTEQKELLDLFESDPDTLAKRLNDLEPSKISKSPESISSNQVIEPLRKEEKAVSAAVPPKVVEEKPMPVKKKAAVDSKQKVEPVSEELAKSSSVKPSGVKPDIASDPDLPDVVKQIEGQAFEGIPEAQHDLAAIYTAGHAGVEQNYGRAAYWFEQAAKADVPNAQYNLGVLHHQGLGVQQSMEEAIKWYESAAKLGHPEAQYNLGIAYIEGVGVNYDARKAAKYFEAAADQGVMEAAYNLGLIYENGLLGNPKPDEALLWYKTAADAGSPEARAALDQLARTLGIGLEEVNKLVENVRNVKGSKPKAVEDAYSEFVNPKDAPAVNAKQVMISQIQQYLMDSGLYPGPADGINGPLTKDAIRTYQAGNEMTVTGLPTDDLLRHMLANTASYDMPSADDVGSREQ